MNSAKLALVLGIVILAVVGLWRISLNLRESVESVRNVPTKATSMARTHAAAAADARRRMRWAETVDESGMVLRLDPSLTSLGGDRTSFLDGLAESLIRSGQPEEALEQLHKYLQMEDDPVLRERLGHAYEATGDLRSAEMSWRDVAASWPGRVEPYLALGRLRLNARDPKGALDWLERARRNEPNRYEVLALMGSAHRLLGHVDEAEKFGKAAAQVRRTLPENPGGMGADVVPHGSGSSGMR